MTLPPGFTARSFAHRGLHDVANGVIENSRAAVQAAIDAGYGIEIDVQLSADGEAMVFHDYGLERLTGAEGPVARRSAAELGALTLAGSAPRQGIPTLTEILELVAGRVPVLVEIKDQDGALGPKVGPLEKAVARALSRYPGPVAVMSFNPHSMAEMQRLAPEVPRGLTTCRFDAEDWPTIPQARRDALREIPDFETVGASFVSHRAEDANSDRLARLRDGGAAILCWTVRSEEAERQARQHVDAITFEGYRPRT
ncbi:glycerophosphodiester phosphodiesterase family protein [Histidinibacterium aquaticum]|uniref:Phosphodiesterase n=1 Tax=Histidinibacterium aquaticum TaxID=2613962 RepID=A0A5J5GFV8_9RHOB|nr:glycerophosphodiester phosphodiesterase family protein [Histidinibacterium aquaticum]KAA9007109.1 phosphodiesterase [Histidinibacterium aquaticum]